MIFSHPIGMYISFIKVCVNFKACPNGKCFTVKHTKTLLVGKTFFRLATLFCAV